MAETLILNATQSDGNITFSETMNYVIIKNVSGYPVYININDTATTSHFKIDVSEILEIGLNGIDDVHAICDTGQTAKLNIIGFILQ
jgi:hypothetical protein